MTTADVLVAARAKLQQGACKGWYARRVDKTECDPTDPSATAWCPAGAILSVMQLSISDWTGMRRDPSPEVSAVREAIMAHLDPGWTLPTWWDRSRVTKTALLNLFDRAIEAAR